MSGGVISVDEAASLLDLVYPVLIWELASESLNDMIHRKLIVLVGFGIFEILWISVLR